MPNYQNGKIYSIRSHKTDKIYIGATIQPLSYRFNDHKKNAYKKNCTSHLILEYDDAYIELIEECKCDNKDQLSKREGEIIRSTSNCVNKVIPNRTKKEYRNDNHEIINEKLRIYREKNKDKIAIKKKEEYEKNKDKFREKNKLYREKYKDEIKERKKKYYDNNKDKINEKRRLNRKNNKEKQINENSNKEIKENDLFTNENSIDEKKE